MVEFVSATMSTWASAFEPGRTRCRRAPVHEQQSRRSSPVLLTSNQHPGKETPSIILNHGVRLPLSFSFAWDDNVVLLNNADELGQSSGLRNDVSGERPVVLAERVQGMCCCQNKP